MRQLTIVVSRDLDQEVAEVLSDMNVECYVKFADAYGISHRCQGSLGENMPWEASVMLVTGEDRQIEELAEKILQIAGDKEYKPCLMMSASPVEKIWK